MLLVCLREYTTITSSELSSQQLLNSAHYRVGQLLELVVVLTVLTEDVEVARGYAQRVS